MPSPFPGMDPYLEGYLWPDVHSALASKIRQFLTPLLRPKYAARLEVYLAEDPFPEGEIGILYPDVEVVKTSKGQRSTQTLKGRTLTITPPALTLPVTQSVTVRLTSVEIRDTANNKLITSIEILSPVNKCEPGLTTYRQKRQRLYQADVHLLELDLLRRGTRPFAQPRLPKVPYCIALTRAQSNQVEIWPIELPTALPVVPVPLQSPDPEVPLDLQSVLAAIYDEAAYDLTLDYSQSPPPPALEKSDIDWIKSITG
ncbi:MAG: DUF4058 family protein [Cyanobacteria bacterium J06614_10]